VVVTQVRQFWRRIWYSVTAGVLLTFPVRVGAQPQDAAAPAKPAVVRGNTIFERTTLTTGPADASVSYGVPGDVVLMCDWNGDGSRTPGAFRDGVWYLRNATDSGQADVTPFQFGDPGDVPVCGHWGLGSMNSPPQPGNGPGVAETPGVFRDGVFYLRWSDTTGVADQTVPWGDPGDVPVVGRWNSSVAISGVGVVRNQVWFLRDVSAPTTFVPPFTYGDPGDEPVVGDWNADNTDTVGVFRNGTWLLHNTNDSGIADITFAFGDPGDIAQPWR
jgi:hypothetical protein